MTEADTTPAVSPARMRFRLPPQGSRLLRARERIRDYLTQHGLDRQACDIVVLCVEEACTNAIRHSDSIDPIDVTLQLAGDDLVATISDHGVGFDTGRFDPEVMPDLMSTGGRGLFLMAHLMDDIELRTAGGLTVRMVKRNVVTSGPTNAVDSGLVEVEGRYPLQHRDARLRILLEELDEAFLAIDWECRILYANQHACRLLGRQREELVGVGPATLWPTFEGSTLEAQFREAMDVGIASVRECHGIISDHWLETRVYPTAGGISAYMRAIDERKRVESERERLVEELRRSEELFRATFEQAAVGIAHVSLDGRFQKVNDELCRFLGYPREELIRVEFADITYPPDLAADLEQSRRLLAGEIDTYTMDKRYVRKDGGIVWASLTGSVVRDERGDASFFVVVVQDIQARKEAEMRLRLALDAAYLISFEWDIERDEVYRFVSFDPDLGPTGEGRPSTFDAVRDIVHPEDRAQFSANVEAALRREDGRYESEFRIRRRDGEVAWLYERGRVERDDDGRPVRLIGLSQDVTDRKRLEEERELEHRRLRAVLDALPVALGITDADGRVVELNPAVERIWGGPPPKPSDIDEYGAYKGWWPDSGERLRPEDWTLARALRTGKPILDELIDIERFDGTRGTLLSSTVPFTDDAGKLIGAVGITDDVTPHVRRQRLTEALNRIGGLIHSTLDYDEIMQRALDEAARTLGADFGTIAVLDGPEWVARYEYGASTPRVGAKRVYDEFERGRLAVERGEPMFACDTGGCELGIDEDMRRHGLRATALLGLFVRDSPIGLLVLHYRVPQQFGESEAEFLRLLGSSISLALENAQLYEAQRRVATTLQENFIHPVPHVEGIELAVLTKPAYKPDLVGGDFHDIFELKDGRVALLVGDVAGKGVRAAGLTETVRSAVRTAALLDDSPALILATVDELLRTQYVDLFITAALVVLDPASGRLVAADAGHPPPIVFGPSSCRQLELTCGTPLGTFEGPYREAADSMASGEALLLHTDGLTEARRGRELFGEARLLEAVGSLRDRPVQEVAAALRDAAEEFAGRLRDDLEIVVVRLV